MIPLIRDARRVGGDKRTAGYDVVNTRKMVVARSGKVKDIKAPLDEGPSQALGLS